MRGLTRVTSRDGRGRTLACALAAVALGGCNFGIAGFRAEPNVICGGSQTMLSWVATTDGTLSAVPADASLGAVAETGTRTVSPAGPTTYRLTVKRFWKTATREAAVEVVAAPSEAKQIGASVADPSTTCEGNTLALTVIAPPADWDARIKVARVRLIAGVKRTYNVGHADVVTEVAPGEASTAFAGSPVQGSWHLSTPLEPGEACGRNVPRSLIIEVSSTCAP
jgi:hypothetical protein